MLPTRIRDWKMEQITVILTNVCILKEYYYTPLKIEGIISNNTRERITFYPTCDNGRLVNSVTLNPTGNFLPTSFDATMVDGENTIDGNESKEFTIYVRNYNLNSNMTLSLKNLNGDIIASSIIEFPNLQNR